MGDASGGPWGLWWGAPGHPKLGSRGTSRDAVRIMVQRVNMIRNILSQRVI